VTRWRIRRIVNGCAAQQLVARQVVIAPEFISYGLVIRAINSKTCLRQYCRRVGAHPANLADELHILVRRNKRDPKYALSVVEIMSI